MIKLGQMVPVAIMAQLTISCGSPIHRDQIIFKNPVIDTVSSAILTLTRVKRPWYAWRSFILARMEKSIPEYMAISGLNQKTYYLSEDKDYFGGIYLWQNETAANKWFDKAWYDRIEKKYGHQGNVEYFEIKEIASYAEILKHRSEFWSVLSLADIQQEITRLPEGIITSIRMKNATGQICYLTIWINKSSAEEFFKNAKIQGEFYDSPVTLRIQ